MALLNVIPLWAWKYFPSQDGPAHLYNSFVLAHYQNSPLFQEYFRLHWSPAGNALTHVLLAALLLVLPPLIAEHLLLTLYCLGLPFAFLYAVRAWNRSDDAMSYAAFLLIYTSFLHLGFWNFCFSIALFLVAFGYLTRNAFRRDGRAAAVMCVLALATYSAHIVSWVILVLAASMLFAAAILRREFNRLPLTGAFTLIPGLFALLYYAASPASAGGGFLTWRQRLWTLFGVPFLRGYTIAETRLALLIAVSALGLFIAAVWMYWRRHGTLPWNSAFGLCAICVVLALTIGGTANFLQARVALYAVIFLLLATATIGEFGGAAPVVRTLLISLSVAGLLLRIGPYQHWNLVLTEYVQAGHHLPPDSTVLPVRYAADQDGRLRPTLHAAGLMIPGSFVDLFDYEAAFDYFPVQFQANRLPKPTLGWTTELDHFPPVFKPRQYEQITGGRVDFILVEVPEEQPEPWPEQKYSAATFAGYRLVFKSQPHGLVRLYQRSATAQ